MQVPMRQEYIRMRLQGHMADQRVICVDTEEITLHEDAAKMLGQAAANVALEAGVPVSLIHDRMFQYVFRLEPAGSLLLVLSVPERDIEINVELPAQMWKTVPAVKQ